MFIFFRGKQVLYMDGNFGTGQYMFRLTKNQQESERKGNKN